MALHKPLIVSPPQIFEDDTMRDHVNFLLRELGEFQLDEKNICSLLVDGQRECNVELDDLGEWLYLHSPIVHCPAEAQSLQKFALRKNLFGIGVRGGHLGLCSATGFLVFSRRFPPADLDALSLRAAFDTFLASAIALEEEIATAVTEPLNELDHHDFAAEISEARLKAMIYNKSFN